MAPTLIPPPPNNKAKAPIENVLQLTSLSIIGPDLFTNTRPLWRPPGARGIYGGAAIAQTLAAAQLTIPPPSEANEWARFYVHSMHCYFVLAGNADIPIIYSVERVREGRSFMTRTVQARQEGRCIFTTTLSFVREGSAGAQTVDHAHQLPPSALHELRKMMAAETEISDAEKRLNAENGDDAVGPVMANRLPVSNGEFANDDDSEARRWAQLEREELEDEKRWGEYGMRFPASPGSIGCDGWSKEPDGDFLNDGTHLEIIWHRDPIDTKSAGSAESDRPETKRTQSWIKARGQISPEAGHEPHLAALAYMSDSWFIGTVARVNNLWRWSSPEKTVSSTSSSSSSNSDADGKLPPHAREMAALEQTDNRGSRLPARKIGMMVSLDHAIYFHRPMDIKADEWMFQEMESPWAGDGRGLVIQRIWNQDGRLLATCVQEGLVRLMQGDEKGKL